MTTLDHLPLNALGDPRWWGYEIHGTDEDRSRIEADLAREAQHQIDLRQSLPPAGRRRRYLDHLHELAAETGIFLTLYRPPAPSWQDYAGRFWPATKKIEAPIPVTRMHYLTGLHEFGHAALPQLGGTSEYDVTAEGIYGEMRAYVWAFEHSRVDPTWRDCNDAKGKLLYDAAKAGWQAGPLHEWVPLELREPVRAAWEKLEPVG